VHDQLAVIEQHPAALTLAFPPQGQTGGVGFEAVLHRSGDGSHLHVAEAAADHKPVGQGRDFVHPDQADVDGLAIVAGLGGKQGEGAAVGISHRRSRW
jgi:hypothetical protein